MCKLTTRSWLLIAAMGIVLGVASRAEAGTLTVYNDLPSFQAATTGLSDVNFNGIVGPTSFTSYADPPGYTDAATGTNFAFSPGGGSVDIVGRNYYSPTNFSSDFLAPSIGNQGQNELITLSGPHTAIGLMFSTYTGTANDFLLSNGDFYVGMGPPAFGNVAFLGFTDSTPFTSLTITVTPLVNEAPILLDLQFGAVAPAAVVPEPASLTLFSLGSLALAGLLRRRP
jgi:hypothetical protein